MSVGAVNKQTGDRIPTAGMPAIDNALSLISTNPVQNAIITAALAGKQDKLTFDDTPTDNSNNPVKSNGIYDALALKQNATDNNLTTTDKTVVGAINEHEGDISSLKSGLTNYEATTNAALDLPNGTGKNLIPMTVSGIKSYNTGGTWSGNAYTLNNVVFTILTDSDGNVTGINANGTASARSDFNLVTPGVYVKGGSYKLNGCPADGSSSKYRIQVWNFTQNTGYNDYGTGADANVNTGDNMGYQITVYSGYAADNLVFYPMLRPATITDATFAPYIPSVESRIEAVESGLNNVAVKNFTNSTRIFEFEENENSRQITIANSGIYRFVISSTSSNECTVRVGANQYSVLYAYDGVTYNAVLPIFAGTTLLLTRTGTSSIAIDFLS